MNHWTFSKNPHKWGESPTTTITLTMHTCAAKEEHTDCNKTNETQNYVKNNDKCVHILHFQ